MTPREEDKPNVDPITDHIEADRLAEIERRLDAMTSHQRLEPPDDIGARIAARSFEALRRPAPQPTILARLGGPVRLAAALVVAAGAVLALSLFRSGSGGRTIAEMPPDEALETWIVNVATWDEMSFDATEDIEDAIALTDDAFVSWPEDELLFEETL